MKAIGLVAEEYEKLKVTKENEENVNGYREVTTTTEEIKGAVMTSRGDVAVKDSEVDFTGSGILYTIEDLKAGYDIEDEKGRKWNIISKDFSNEKLDVNKYHLERL